MPIVQKLVKKVGSGIGAARESYLEHQDGKARATSSTQAYSTTPSPPPAQQNTNTAFELDGSAHKQTSEDELEEDWFLDDASRTIDPPAYDDISPAQDAAEVDPKDLAGAVLRIAPPLSSWKGPLPLPVAIPQRRPGAKGRGFVRAYAPLLANSAIDQQTFLLFLKNMHRASSASKGLKVVFLAGAVAGVVPEPFTQIASAVVQVSAGAAMEVQRRYRANAFLDEMNERLFKPRGLFAMVVAYKPDARKAVEVGEFDAEASVARYSDAANAGWKQKIRSGSGVNHAGLSIGEVAPLVYPAVEDAREDGTEEQRGRWKRFEKFMGEYGDKRAQATYQNQHPDSALAAPQTQFRSRYADPNSAANSGSLISLVTGGAVNPKEWRGDRGGGRRGVRGIRERRRGGERREGGPFGIRKALQEDVMYLLIVNMPSEAELASARARLAVQQP